MSVLNNHASIAFHGLCQLADAHAQELEHYQVSDLADSSDDDNDSVNPEYTSFLNSIGPNGIHKMTSFTPNEISKLHDIFQPFFSNVWNYGQEKWCTYTIYDVLFMSLTVIKNGGAWNFLSLI